MTDRMTVEAGTVRQETVVPTGPESAEPVPPGGPVPGVGPGPGRERRHKTLLGKYALIGVWAAMALFFYAELPHTFGRVATLQSIFGSQQVLVFLALAFLTTTTVGEFDLSLSSIMGLAATMIPVLAGLDHMNVVLACVVSLAACVACGVLNAFIVVKLGISSLVATLGMGTLLVGLAMWISHSSEVSINNAAFSKVSLFSILGLPVSFYYGLVLVILFAYINSWTPLGRYMVFVGSNREVARLAGIRVNRIRAGSYVVASLIAGLGGLLLVSSTGGFDASGSAGYLLPSLAAVFLGTAVVQPGRFNPVGTVIGIYFLETGIFGLELFGYSGWVQDIFYGGGLVVAVGLATLVRNQVVAE